MSTKNKQIDYEESAVDNFEGVFTFEHLLASAARCKRNVGWKASVQNFFLELPYNVFIIYHEITNHKFKVHKTYKFDICERGKKRHICSVHIRERVVQRCLCDYCLLPILTKTFIYDNCASLKGKGIDFAINRIKKHINTFYKKYGTDGYVLLFDFSDFFASVPHDVIMEMFARYIHDKDILAMIKLFIDMEEGGKGLCLGNQVSQVAALLIANPIDHYIKDKCGVKVYVRCMDDGIVIHQDKEFLKTLLSDITKIANDLGLEINQKKTKIVKLSQEFVFLKKKIHVEENGKIYIRIKPRSINVMRRKLKKLHAKYLEGIVSYEDIESSYQAWRSYAMKYDSYGSIKSMDKLFVSLFGGNKFWTYPIGG